MMCNFWQLMACLLTHSSRVFMNTASVPYNISITTGYLATCTQANATLTVASIVHGTMGAKLAVFIMPCRASACADVHW